MKCKSLCYLISILLAVSFLACGDSDDDVTETEDNEELQVKLRPEGADIYVPQDYRTIQAAIEAAQDGETVVVGDRTYSGEGNRDLDFKGKRIILKSENGADKCIIDCENSGGGFIFRNGEDHRSVVQGFTIMNATSVGIVCRNSSPLIRNNVITGSRTVAGIPGGAKGGGIYCIGGGSPTIENNIITRNSAAYGGGVYCEGLVSATIINNIITNNNAGRDGGAIYCISTGSLTITNNLISGNTAQWEGGAIYCARLVLGTIVNNTITGNTAGISSGAILCREGSLIIKNTILWDNIAPEGNEISLIQVTIVPEITVSYSDVAGGQAGIKNRHGRKGVIVWLDGNIDVNPLFVDPSRGNYQLQANSPCIDAGTGDGAAPNDIAGNPRPIGNGVDIGAYEYVR